MKVWLRQSKNYKRKLFIENLNGIIKQKHEELTAGNEKLDIQYHPSIRIIEDWSLKE